MIGIVVVSHSPRLAEAAVDLALEMVHGTRPKIVIAAGAGDGPDAGAGNRTVTGTDATRVAAAITEVASPDGVLVIVDLGSAVLSADLALELVHLPGVDVRISGAPFVEGILAGIVRAAGGGTLDEVEREALGALESKQRGEAGARAGDARDDSERHDSHGDTHSDSRTEDFVLRNPSGLHIRPASLVVMALAPLDVDVTVANLRTASAERRANSPTALLALGAMQGDVIRVVASGPNAAEALAAIRELIEDGFGEHEDSPANDQANDQANEQANEPASAQTRGRPLGVSPGRAVGSVVRMPEPLLPPAASPSLPDSARATVADRIDAATSAVGAALRVRAERVSGEARDILTAAATLAVDPSLVSGARAAVLERGDSAEFAVWTTVGALADGFARQGGLMAERVADLHDVRNRVVAELLGRPEPGVPSRAEPYVLVARDLAPADTALLDPALCLAIVTVEGGPTSHTAILSRSLGVPAVVSFAEALDIPEGTIVLVDGTAGTVVIDPRPDEIGIGDGQEKVRAEFSGTGVTSDGHRIELLANVGTRRSVDAAIAARAEGIGLFRTEFLYLDRTEAPTIDEQVAAYRTVFSRFSGRTVIIRTLDAGADKPLAFVSTLDEVNPALGIRGYRTSWKRPDLIEDQLTAIATAAGEETANVQVMAPMIDTPDEALEFAQRCAAHGLTSVGVMIETPAAAIMARELLSSIQFVSIGTNDLAQYTMAADRELGELAQLNDPWQPAVLRIMRITFDAGSAAGKPVGVCGEAAADPLLAAVLVGLGASSLSMSARALGQVGQLLGGVSLAQCRRAAIAATGARTAQAARAAAAIALWPEAPGPEASGPAASGPAADATGRV